VQYCHSLAFAFGIRRDPLLERRSGAVPTREHYPRLVPRQHPRNGAQICDSARVQTMRGADNAGPRYPSVVRSAPSVVPVEAAIYCLVRRKSFASAMR
jgi:hypothetical protein